MMNTPLLEIHQVEHAYNLGRIRIQVLKKVSLSVPQGEVIGIAGESGAGKSTLLRIMAGLEKPHAGKVMFQGKPLVYDSPRQMRNYYRNIGMVFQHPRESFNPRWPIGIAIEEPLRLQQLSGAERKKRVQELAEQVGLPRYLLGHYPHQLSGGQLQRAAIARALVRKPTLLFLDEPTAALDVSIQAQILNVLKQLQRHYQFGMVMVSHDLPVLRFIAHQLIIMRTGEIVETGTPSEIINHPRTPYAQQLIASVLE